MAMRHFSLSVAQDEKYCEIQGKTSTLEREECSQKNPIKNAWELRSKLQHAPNFKAPRLPFSPKNSKRVFFLPKIYKSCLFRLIM